MQADIQLAGCQELASLSGVIMVATAGSGVAAAAGRTLAEGWSGVGNRGALTRLEGLGVTPKEAEHMEERSSLS